VSNNHTLLHLNDAKSTVPSHKPAPFLLIITPRDTQQGDSPKAPTEAHRSRRGFHRAVRRLIGSGVRVLRDAHVSKILGADRPAAHVVRSLAIAALARGEGL